MKLVVELHPENMGFNAKPQWREVAKIVVCVFVAWLIFPTIDFFPEDCNADGVGFEAVNKNKNELVVSRVLSRSCERDDHLSRPAIADRLKQPTRESNVTSRHSSLFGLASSGVYKAT